MQDQSTKKLSEFSVLIGLDWSETKHDIRLYNPKTERTWSMTVANISEELEKWVLQLRQDFNGGMIAICMEHCSGMLVHKLMSFNFITLYLINPAMSSNYRTTFFPSRAKDDPVDAQLLLELLIHHHDRITPWRPDTEETRALSILCESRRNFVEDRKRYAQKLKAVLKRYYPQALEMCGNNLTSDMACSFLIKWPTAKALQSAKEHSLRSFYYKHNSRSSELISSRIEIKRNIVPVCSETLILESSVIQIQLLVNQIRT